MRGTGRQDSEERRGGRGGPRKRTRSLIPFCCEMPQYLSLECCLRFPTQHALRNERAHSHGARPCSPTHRCPSGAKRITASGSGRPAQTSRAASSSSPIYRRKGAPCAAPRQRHSRQHDSALAHAAATASVAGRSGQRAPAGTRSHAHGARRVTLAGWMRARGIRILFIHHTRVV